jgi:hypothetical protein
MLAGWGMVESIAGRLHSLTQPEAAKGPRPKRELGFEMDLEFPAAHPARLPPSLHVPHTTHARWCDPHRVENVFGVP